MDPLKAGQYSHTAAVRTRNKFIFYVPHVERWTIHFYAIVDIVTECAKAELTAFGECVAYNLWCIPLHRNDYD